MAPEDSLRDKILRDVSATTDLALTDVLPFAHATAAAVETYKAGSSELDEAAFWHKSLVRSFLAHVEVQCAIIRTSIAANASRLRAPIPANKLQEIASVGRRRSTEESVTLAFRHLPLLFGLDIPFARGDENYRGFKALTDARESFTHPKKERDVCPFELFACTRPAMEWFFRHWMSILLRCSHSVYGSSLDLAQLAVPQLFKDAMLAEYRERQKELTTEVADSPALHAVRTVILPLLADTSRAKQLVKSATRATPAIGTQAALRSLIRTIFCEIEGTTNAAESLLRTRRSDDPAVDKSFLVGTHEDVRETVASTIEAFSQEFGFDETVRRSGDAWEAFLVVRGLRDRLTHPKKLADLEVDSDDFAAILHIESWWHEGDIDRCMKLNAARM